MVMNAEERLYGMMAVVEEQQSQPVEHGKEHLRKLRYQSTLRHPRHYSTSKSPAFRIAHLYYQEEAYYQLSHYTRNKHLEYSIYTHL